jgi:dTDP-glucose pyrophosphorylase
MKKWKDIVVSPDATILQTIEVIDKHSLQIALVADENYRLLGTVTDGDIRRGILKGIPLDQPVRMVMNQDPIVAGLTESLGEIRSRMIARRLRHIPVVDEQYRIADLYIHDQFDVDQKKENWVVLMAGGLGTRLRPLTDHSPKPLLRVGNRPILETILLKFAEFNFNRFYLSVNYKSEQIKSYFQDGAKWGVNIQYLEESKRLGTAGALSLLPGIPDKPIIVMNGDLLTKINFEQLLEFHESNGLPATMCVREFQHQIPYGVVKTEEHRLVDIVEKPVHSYFVNAGIYVLSPEVLRLIPHDTYYDMTTLFETLIRKNMGAGIFPIREYWLDIGRMSDFEKANMDYEGEFA